MSLAALALVLLGALLHATWNLLAKQAASGAQFVFLYTTAGAVLFAPAMIYLYGDLFGTLSGVQAAALLASAVTHLFYALVLQRAYAVGDFTVVYPLARGTGPLLSTLGAVLLLGERPSTLAFCGALAVVSGVFFLAGGRQLFDKGAVSGVRQGLLTGVLIAFYTLVDARSVSALLVPPLMIDFTNNVFRSAVLLPHVLQRRAELVSVWKKWKWHVLGVAVMGPSSYLLVLHVLKTTPVSYVAPAREVSMLLAAILGATVLGEPSFRERSLAAVTIALGVAALALG